MSDERLKHDATEFRAAADFDTWYTQNTFDYAANPLGSRECALQREAWNAALSTIRSTL